MNQKDKAIKAVALVMCIVTIVGLVAGVIGSNIAPTTSLESLMGNRGIVQEEQLTTILENHKNKDYSLKTMLSILGNPGTLVFDYDGEHPTTYTNPKDIENMMTTYMNHPLYSQKSVVQLMWQDESDNLLFTTIATEYNNPTVVGLTSQTMKAYQKGSKFIPKTEFTINDFKELTTETIEKLGDGYIVSTQYPLLECNYTKNNLSSSDLSSTMTTKVVQNGNGLITIVLKDGEPYQLYQEYDSEKLPVYDTTEKDKLFTGLNEAQFLKVYPDAVKAQLFNHEENNTEYYIVSYVVKEKDKDGKVEEMVYAIVDDMLYIYDENGNLTDPQSGLIIETGSGHNK